MKYGVSVECNEGVDDVIRNMASNPFCKKEELVNLQKSMYMRCMEIECECLKREMADLICGTQRNDDSSGL